MGSQPQAEKLLHRLEEPSRRWEVWMIKRKKPHIRAKNLKNTGSCLICLTRMDRGLLVSVIIGCLMDVYRKRGAKAGNDQYWNARERVRNRQCHQRGIANHDWRPFENRLMPMAMEKLTLTNFVRAWRSHKVLWKRVMMNWSKNVLKYLTKIEMG